MANIFLTGVFEEGGEVQTLNIADSGRALGKTINVAHHRYKRAKMLGLSTDQEIIDFMASDTKPPSKYDWMRNDPKTKKFFDFFNLGIPLEINHG